MKNIFTIKYFDRLSSYIFKLQPKKDKDKPSSQTVSNLMFYAKTPVEELYRKLNTIPLGLSKKESKRRLVQNGYNEVMERRQTPWYQRLISTLRNPLVLLLLVLSFISFISGDITTGIIIFAMVFLSVALRFYQENQAYNAATHLQSLVKTTCTVVRENELIDIDLKRVVLGDIIQLSAGDLVPADLRLISSKDLFINQSLLTGEALPVEKHVEIPPINSQNPLELQNICFMGTNIESGTARAVVIATNGNTYFGNIAKSIIGARVQTSFDKGIERVTWLLIGFMVVMVPLVFFINGFGKGNWWEAFLFAISVAVGLTPEMLPAIVTVNLSKGAISMSKKKVIVKRLSSIQNFGAMDILCTDKTGTLTENRIVLVKDMNIKGKAELQIIKFAYLNSFFQTGFKNLLDSAVIDYAKKNELTKIVNDYQKIDELPFDFVRRRLSVIIRGIKKDKLLICKGSIEEITSICSKYAIDGQIHNLESESRKKIKSMKEELSREGFRVIAVAYKEIHTIKTHYEITDENDLIFLGLMAFFDPPKPSAALAIDKLKKHGIDIKVLTGDNAQVTQKICQEVKLPIKETLLGHQIDSMTDEELKIRAKETSIFAKLSPENKKRVVEALQKQSFVVGFLGDGINDAPGLRAADVGISVNSAVDIAKESADIILLEMSLTILSEGVTEGRKVFGNIIKYIKMGASSNFGNMFSVLGASLFLPFLPMNPLQLLTNNLLYDISQTAIPTDNVDEEYIEKPRKWEIKDIGRFMLFIGPISSVFDYVTFVIMLFLFHAWSNPSLFQTGWFVESLLTQTLIVHVIRSRKIPFLQTVGSKPLIFTTLIIMLTGIYLTFSPIAHSLHFSRLPILYWPILGLILVSYITLTQIIKSWYIKRFGYN